MNLRKDQLCHMIVGALLGAVGSFIMELVNCQTMNEMIQGEIHKQLEAEYQKNENEDDEES